MADILGKETLTNIGKSTVFGAASSGCSYGAVAIGKGIFRKGAHPTNVFAFMFASTNLIVELRLMIWILLGWEFLLAEIIGGFVLIALMGTIVHYTLPEGSTAYARSSATRTKNAVSNRIPRVVPKEKTSTHWRSTARRTNSVRAAVWNRSSSDKQATAASTTISGHGAAGTSSATSIVKNGQCSTVM